MKFINVLLWMIGPPVDTNTSTIVTPSITPTTAISVHSNRICQIKIASEHLLCCMCFILFFILYVFYFSFLWAKLLKSGNDDNDLKQKLISYKDQHTVEFTCHLAYKVLIQKNTHFTIL